MASRLKVLLALVGALALVASACTSSDDPEVASSTTSSLVTTSEPVEDDAAGATETSAKSLVTNARAEVALVFTYHETFLPPIGGAIELPNARLAAARHYLDVPQLLQEFPDAKASVAVSAPTILQLESLANPRGPQRTVDRHYLIASKPTSDLTPDERQFILNNFFEGPATAFETYERWDELRERRNAGSTLTDADLGDAAVLFHLAQLDPEVIEANEGLSTISQKGASFTLEDARRVLQAIDNQVDLIGGTYADLYADGSLEVITSTGALPRPDPIRQKDATTAALGIAADFLGQAPNGLTLVGDVATDSDLAAMVAGGAQWVLATSPSDQSGNIAPQTLGVSDGSIHIVSANAELSQLVAGEYSELSAADAVEDFLTRLGEIADRSGSPTAPLVTVVFDGAETFDAYENDGTTFLRTLFNALTTSDEFVMTTPSAYLTQHANSIATIDSADSIFNEVTQSWQGEPEEEAAQRLIRQAIIAVDELVDVGELALEDIEVANRLIRNAEAADFAFYFGQDHDSGRDQIYDRGFRQWLVNAYESLAIAVPASVITPIVAPRAVTASTIAAGPVAINVDGNPSDWASATLFDFADTNDVMTDFGVAVDGDSLALRFDGGIESEVQIYLAIPRNDPDRTTTIAGDALGFGATHMVIWTDTEGACLAELLPPDSQIGSLPPGCVLIQSGLSEAGVELKIPSDLLGGLEAGDVLAFRVRAGSSVGPIAGPILAEVPVASP